MHRRTFYFAKINIHGNIFSPNLDQLIEEEIPKVIKNAHDVTLFSWSWSFTDLQESIVDERKIIYGNVTKSNFRTLKVKDGKQTFRQRSEKQLAETAFFVYDLKNELLIFEANSKISIDDFIKFFTRLLSQDHTVGKVIIKTIPEDYEILSHLLSYDKVTHLCFDLIHPNPGKKHFNTYNQLIHDGNLKKLEVHMENEDEGIDLKTDGKSVGNNVIKDGIDLVESGYGEIHMKGENYSFVTTKKNREKKIKTVKSFNSKKSIKKFFSREQNNEVILKEIVSTLKNKFL